MAGGKAVFQSGLGVALGTPVERRMVMERGEHPIRKGLLQSVFTGAGHGGRRRGRKAFFICDSLVKVKNGIGGALRRHH